MNISFIVPAYNCADTIEESLLSIIRSNLRPKDEIVVVDDCSTDNTLKVLNPLKKTHHAIKVIRNKWNKGSSETRNVAIENCKFEHIFCLDSDNVLAQNSIINLQKFMIQNKADAASFQELHYFNKDIENITHKWIFKEGEIIISDALSSGVFPGSSGNYLFTKESWIRAGRYPQCRTLDTWGFGIRQLFTGSKMITLPKSHYFHRYGHESNWVRERKKGKNSVIALQILLPFVDLIEPRDVNYIMSHEYRYVWIDRLDVHPIRLINQNKGVPGIVVESVRTNKREGGNLKTKIARFLKYVKK